MKIYDKKGRELRPNLRASRPGDEVEPQARPSPHYGIFGEVTLPWAYAQIGSSFVQNDGTSVLVLSAEENVDGPRWDRLELALAPADWREIEAARLAAEKAATADAAAREAARLARESAQAARISEIRAQIEAAGLPTTRTYTVGGGWVEDDVGYAAGPSSEWSKDHTETVDVAEEIFRSGRAPEQAIAEMLRAGEEADAAARALALARMDGRSEWLGCGGYPATTWLKVAPAVILAEEANILREAAAARRAATVERHARELSLIKTSREELASGSTYWPRYNAQQSATVARVLRREIAAVDAANLAKAAREQADREARKNAPKQKRGYVAPAAFTGQKLVNNPFANISL